VEVHMAADRLVGSSIVVRSWAAVDIVVVGGNSGHILAQRLVAVVDTRLVGSGCHDMWPGMQLIVLDSIVVVDS